MERTNYRPLEKCAEDCTKIAPTNLLFTHTHTLEVSMSSHCICAILSFIDLECCVASFIQDYDYIVTHHIDPEWMCILQSVTRSLWGLISKPNMICHVWLVLHFSSLQSACPRKTAAADYHQVSLRFVLRTAGCMVLSTLGVSMGGMLFRRINSGSPCAMAIHFLMSHLKRCLPSYIFHAVSNTVTGLKSIDLWQTHLLFWCRSANWWFQGYTLDKQRCFRVVCKEQGLTFNFLCRIWIASGCTEKQWSFTRMDCQSRIRLFVWYGLCT